jgi:hypothetical protein
MLHLTARHFLSPGCEKSTPTFIDGGTYYMANALESSSSAEMEVTPGQPGGWFKVGAVAAGSALAGGLLAAWWYRKTLNKLRQAEEDAQNPHFGISEGDPPEEA